MYRESKDGKTTILELHKLNDSIEAPVVIAPAPSRLSLDGDLKSGNALNRDNDLNKTLEITGVGPSSSSIPRN